jgi:hypothetical protein
MKKKIWFINVGTVNLKERLYDYEDEDFSDLEGEGMSIH